MKMIVSDQLVTALATSAVPSFAVLIGILINNQRLNDFARNMNVRFSDLSRCVDLRFNEVNRRIEDCKDNLHSDMFRIEQVLDARLKHLEEHLR
jgi:hypothetical protein